MKDSGLHPSALSLESRPAADYAMAFDLVSKIARVMTEDMVVQKTFELFTLLCAPESIAYLQILDGRPRDLFLSPASAADTAPAKDRLLAALADSAWTVSEKGFIIRICLENNTLGILAVEGISFVQFKDHYLNLGVNLAGAIALAIANARYYQHVEASGKALAEANEQLKREIADRQQAEEMLKTQTLQLEVANRSLESFTHSVSHDLRAPLRVVDGYVRMLDKELKGTLKGEAERKLQVIRNNVAKMGQLIDDLLALSRLGYEAITSEILDMENLVQEVWNDLKAVRDQRRLTVEVNHLPAAYGDCRFIKQVLVNLLSNAIKFTKEREVATIEIGGRQAAGETVYYVQDNGVGFDMRYAAKLFGVFQRLHDSGAYEGTGIGLSIVHRIINLHGGRVWAEGRVDEGATFYFSLPSCPLQAPGRE